MNRANAFTLIEVLLAISLMVVISSFIFGWLRHSSSQIQTSGVTLKNDRAVLQAIMLMRKDIAQSSAGTGPKLENETTLRMRCRSSIHGQALHQISYIVQDNKLFRQRDHQAARFLCEHYAIGFEGRDSDADNDTAATIYFWWQADAHDDELTHKMSLSMP